MKRSLHQLKIFAAVVENKGITAAARKLHMTQPAISIQLKQLEDFYGLPLIEVIGKKTHITPAGTRLYQTHLHISAELSALDMEFSQIQGCLKGCLNLAIVSTAKYFIPQLLGKFHHLYPHIEIQLKVMNRKEIIERLNHNLDDVVIMSQLPEKIPIVKEALLEDQLVICAPYQHPFSGRKSIDMKELEAEPFIIREAGSGTRMAMERLFRQYHLKPRSPMELGSSSAIKQAVMAGFGLSVVSRMSIESELALKKLTILNIKGLPIKHFWYSVYLKGKLLSPAAANFINLLRNERKTR